MFQSMVTFRKGSSVWNVLAICVDLDGTRHIDRFYLSSIWDHSSGYITCNLIVLFLLSWLLFGMFGDIYQDKLTAEQSPPQNWCARQTV